MVKVVTALWSLMSVLPLLVSQVYGQFTVDQKQNMLDLHNYWRSKMALSGDENQPTAANMIKLAWDDELEKMAQDWANTCPRGYVHGNRDLKEPFAGETKVGQNMASGQSNFHSIITLSEMWYAEIKDFSYDINKCAPNRVCGHYTQLLWAPTYRVGCAMKECGENFILTCDFFPGGNKNKQLPYIKGPACSICPSSHPFCSKSEGLCVASCSGESDCGCSRVCHNGGVLSTSDCTCKCSAEFTGDSCENPCVNEKPKDCLDYVEEDCADDEWIQHYCKKLCKACKPVTLPLLPMRNRQSLISRATVDLEDLKKKESKAVNGAAEAGVYQWREATAEDLEELGWTPIWVPHVYE